MHYGFHTASRTAHHHTRRHTRTKETNMNTYHATIDGETFSRRSSKVYTHVVIRQHTDGTKLVSNWCGSPELAEKAMQQEEKHGAKWDHIAGHYIQAVDEPGDPNDPPSEQPPYYHAFPRYF